MNEEKVLQKAIIACFRRKYPQYTWHFLNEKKKAQIGQYLMAGLTGIYTGSSGSAVKKGAYIKGLKDQGMVVGQPDLMLPMRAANQSYNGLFMELKRPKINKNGVKQAGGKLSLSQEKFREIAVNIGWNYLVITSLDEAMNALKNHLGH